jgi:beta-lactamase class A
VKVTIVLVGLALVACAGVSAREYGRGDETERAPMRPSATTEVAGYSAAPTSSAGPRPSYRSVDSSVFLAAESARLIDSQLARHSGHAAIVVADGQFGRILFEVDPDTPVFAASLYKLAVLLEAERRIDAGVLDLADRITVTAADHAESGVFTASGTSLTIDEALDRAIVLSDNAAALALVRTFGVASIHATLDREGIGYLRFTDDGAMTTARAIATFFGELARGSLVSREASERMLARLAHQRVADRLPAALPPGAVVAHKTGNLGFATHDAGIIHGPGDAPVVIVVLTWGSGEEEAVQLIRVVAALAHGGLLPASGR